MLRAEKQVKHSMYMFIKLGIYTHIVMPLIRFRIGAPIGTIIFAVGWTGTNYENPSK